MHKKILLTLTLVACLSLSSCGNTDENDNSNISLEDKPNTTVAQPYENPANDYEEDENNNENNNEEEPEIKEPENSLVSYYDILEEEYNSYPSTFEFDDKYGKSYGVSYDIDGKIYWIVEDSWNYIDEDKKEFDANKAGHDSYLCSYNLLNNELITKKIYTSNMPGDKYYSDMVLFDRYIYYIRQDRLDVTDIYSDFTFTLVKCDIDCNEICSLRLGEYESKRSIINPSIVDIGEDGSVLIDIPDYNICIVDPNFTGYDKIPSVELEVEHGFTEEAPTYPSLIYNNNIYGTIEKNGEYTVYRYDMDTKEWSDALYLIGGNPLGHLVGKYVYYYIDDDIYIMNVENGNVIACIDSVFINYMKNDYSYEFSPSNLTRSFKFGASYVLENGQWKKIRIRGDLSDRYDEYDIALSSDDSNSIKYVINDKYYIIDDKYGRYLRTYENGEKDEKEIKRYVE